MFFYLVKLRKSFFQELDGWNNYKKMNYFFILQIFNGTFVFITLKNQPQIRLYFRYFENSKQRRAWGYEICFVCECCADGVNKNLMKFSQLMRFHRRNIHKQNKSRNLTHTLHRKILSLPVFLKSYFHGQIYSWSLILIKKFNFSF